MGKPTKPVLNAKATTAQAKIEKLEQKMAKDKTALASLRRARPVEPVNDYSFKSWGGSTKTLAKMFGKGDELILIHNMGKRCPYCTMWADGFNGLWRHLNNRAAFVVVSPDSPAVQKKFATGRGWSFPMYSAHGNSFFADMGYSDEKGNPWPGVAVFHKDTKGKIIRVSHTSFGPGDNFCVTWDIIDMLPKGQNGWEPQYKY